MGKADAPRSGNPFLMQDMVIEMNSLAAFSFGMGPPRNPSGSASCVRRVGAHSPAEPRDRPSSRKRSLDS